VSSIGKVYIYALYTPEIQSFDYRRPVKAVAIDPEYAHKKARQFVSGGMAEQLVMNEKGWLGHQNTVLHANEGPIYSIQWKNNFIAWANDTGVKVYDTLTSLRITYIDRPSGSPRPDLYKCRLVWKNDTTLMIGWADTVKVAVLKVSIQANKQISKQASKQANKRTVTRNLCFSSMLLGNTQASAGPRSTHTLHGDHHHVSNRIHH
jgi:hypothetical protein